MRPRPGWRERVLGREVHDTGVPVGATVDVVSLRVNPLLRIAILILAWATVSPLGVTGHALYGLILMLVATVTMMSAAIPDTRLGPLPRTVVLAVAAVAGGLLFACYPTSVATAVPFFVCGNAGFRLPRRPAIGVALLGSTVAVIATVVTFGSELVIVSLTVGLPVLIGMNRRERIRALELAHEMVEQTRRAAASEAHAAALDERARMARDLHDVLAHSLSGVNMQLNLADALLEDKRIDDAHRTVLEAQTMVARGLTEARAAVYALRAETLHLIPAVEAMMVGDHEHLEVDGEEPRLSGTTTQALIRIVQEALTNARRYAPGARVAVRIATVTDGSLVVEVHNEAGTVPADSTGGGGMGLVGIRERAGAIGAHATAGPDGGQSGGGWTVRVDVPV
ncbi:sensor histidine kinase [Williamsia sterculiae]|uniref:histidine kinase n=1 Tax=Williamsia sterculiae TaxID=1344003 RepID=A0A1N7FSE3_9NOCA|nr:histidine kinase [Williamsia sterculiae]SIS03292.1 Signal transduction histidine kinase [Williamsia sterculiae]